MNIINQPWLPFRFRNGEIKTLPISAISHPDIIDFSLNRADFQGAAYQFAIGLLQTVFAPEDEDEWEEYFETPPSDNTLKSAFDKVAHAFNVTGEAPLFMQDFSSLEEQKEKTPISFLLIDAPAGNGIENNTDHFVKRGIAEVMSLEMAVLALFTLQINAPGGGPSYYTGLRGGGPLTTLVFSDNADSSLWKKLWLNVINRDFWEYDDPDFTDGSVFPWLKPTVLGKEKEKKVFSIDVHPLYMYWAMPRRIRLLPENNPDICQINGKYTELTVRSYLRKQHGLNYQGEWLHPLTPYVKEKNKEFSLGIPAKERKSGINYNIWNKLVFSDSNEGFLCSKNVGHFHTLYRKLEFSRKSRLFVFGFELEKMKPMGWYISEMPIFHIDDKYYNKIINEISFIKLLTDKFLDNLRCNIKKAWFNNSKDMKIDAGFINLTFWQRSENIFFSIVQNIIEQTQKNDFVTPEQASLWLNSIRKICLSIFDEYALSSLGTQKTLSECIKSRNGLIHFLYKDKEIKKFVTDFKITNKNGEEHGVL